MRLIRFVAGRRVVINDHEPTLYRCSAPKCGWWYILLGNGNWFGPLWESNTAHEMTLDEFIDQYHRCHDYIRPVKDLNE